jgi:hypothetical protein
VSTSRTFCRRANDQHNENINSGRKWTNLLEATLDELVTRHPDVLGGREALEGDLVLVRLLELLTVRDLVDDALDALDDDDTALLHLLLLLIGDLA